MTSVSMPPLIAVLGAGIAGCMATRKLLQGGYRVKLIDLNEGMMGDKSSTRNSARKIHIGSHYFAHLETAKICHEYAMEFIIEFPNCLIGDDNLNQPWRRGRYCVMSNSLTDLQTIENVVNTLRKLYAKQYQEYVEDHPQVKNPLFGPPDKFIVDITDRSELYPEIAKEIEFAEENGTSRQHVTRVYETAESQLDIDKLRRQLMEEQEPHRKSGRLKEHFQTEVTGIKRRKNIPGYVVQVKHLDDLIEYDVDGVVNCTWQNIEKVTRELALPPLDNRVTYIRPKVFLTIQLPDIFKNVHTTTFCVGPFAGINNYGDGTGTLTYEIVTGVGEYKAEDAPPESIEKMMNGDISPFSPEGNKIVEGILQGCAKYLEPGPYRDALLQAIVLEVNIGYVRQDVGKGQTIDIRARESPHHMRQETRLVPLTFAFINFASPKITFANHLACEVVPILKSHLKQKDTNEIGALVEFEKDAGNIINTSRGSQADFPSIFSPIQPLPETDEPLEEDNTERVKIIIKPFYTYDFENREDIEEFKADCARIVDFEDLEDLVVKSAKGDPYFLRHLLSGLKNNVMIWDHHSSDANFYRYVARYTLLSKPLDFDKLRRTFNITRDSMIERAKVLHQALQHHVNQHPNMSGNFLLYLYQESGSVSNLWAFERRLAIETL